MSCWEYAAEAVPSLFVMDDRAAHVERLLHASRVEVRIEAARVAVPDLDLRARRLLAVGAVHGAVHDQQLAVGVAAVVKPRMALLDRRDGHVQRALDGSLGLVVRSEEHTSELQSLMRLSYAVFCLKK